MPDVKHSITIEAPAETVYALVSSGAGLSRWWAEDFKQEPSGAVELAFFNRSTVYHLVPVQFKPPSRVEWACDTGKEWNETRLTFELIPIGERTRLRFTHADWREETDYFVDCTTTWGGLMFRLKSAAEKGVSAPLFLTAGMSS